MTPMQCESAMEARKKLNASEGMAIINKWLNHTDLIDMDSSNVAQIIL